VKLLVKNLRSSSMESLLKRRNFYKGKLAKIVTTANKADADHHIDEETIAALAKEVDDIKSKVNDIQEQIVVLCSDDDEIDSQVDVSEWFQNHIINLQNQLKSLNSIQSSSSIPSHSQVKLPRFELPEFNGKYEQWQSFQDLFIATVDNNSSITPAQKLQYLKSCLKGDPANLIQSFTVTDQNYREAWDLLTDRYDNKRELVNAILRRLHN